MPLFATNTSGTGGDVDGNYSVNKALYKGISGGLYYPKTSAYGNTSNANGWPNTIPTSFKIGTIDETVSSSDQSPWLIIGSDNTAPSLSDYNLKSQITTGLSLGTTTRTAINDTDGRIKRYSCLATNISNSDIVVGEFGMVVIAVAASLPNVSTGGGYRILFDRTVLDTPLTIPANESATLIYDFKTLFPTT